MARNEVGDELSNVIERRFGACELFGLGLQSGSEF